MKQSLKRTIAYLSSAMLLASIIAISTGLIVNDIVQTIDNDSLYKSNRQNRITAERTLEQEDVIWMTVVNPPSQNLKCWRYVHPNVGTGIICSKKESE
jgi:hypothetical protein